MTWRRYGLALAAFLAAVHVRPAAADDATLLRVFLQDGTSLVSYGEFARVADRVVFSLLVANAPEPQLQLVNIAAGQVDWARTNQYADRARRARYVATQAENDYVLLSNTVSKTLTDVAFATDPAERLAIVERARRMLAEWPQAHFNYKAAEVRQLLNMLDETIADLRASAGGSRFDLSLVAVADPPPSSEPILPPPTAVESLDGLLTVARIAESASERELLLATVLKRLDEDGSLPTGWADATRATTRTALDGERRTDRAYQAMIRRVTLQADTRARAADVRGVEQALATLRRSDVVLGQRRPESISAGLRAIEDRLDAARRLRLARDRWIARLPELRRYRAAVQSSLSILAGMVGPLDDIKELSGSSEAALALVRHRAARLTTSIAQVDAPEETRAAHALLVSAAQMADAAAELRSEATASGDAARAWDASSAAAAALMLGAKARADIQAFLREPQLQ